MRRRAAAGLVLVLAPALLAAEPRWESLPAEKAPRARADASVVWTGSEVIVWGGVVDADDASTYLRDGARHDPATSAWTSLPSDGAPSARAWHAAVWTGTEMLVWGGEAGEPMFGDGAAYDPRKDRWRPLSGEGAPPPRVEHSAVWTGSEMLVFAGVQDERSFASGGRCDPRNDTWRALANADFLTGCRAHGAVWTGREMIVFGGINGSRTLRQGGRYDPETDAWRPISMEGAPSARGYPGMVWTGSRVVVFGGVTGVFDGPQAEDGAAYDPATDTWEPLPTDGAPSARGGHATVWTGSELVVWGGGRCSVRGHAPVLRDGAAWRPGDGAWTPLPADGAPSARAHGLAVWTGSHLLVWGGVSGDTWLSDGGLLRLR